MSSDVDSMSALTDDRGEIAVDLECRSCSYDLRGLCQDGRCPECGTPIGLSSHGDLIRFANPDWVATVVRGMTIVLAMVFIGVIIGLGTALLSSQPFQAIALPLGLLTAIVSYYGVWLMTVPEPGRPDADPYIAVRKVIRITLVVGAVGTALNVIHQAVRLPAIAGVTLGVLSVVAMLIGYVGEFAKYIYYERLAVRIPDDKLAKRARFLKWAFTICGALAALGGALIALLMLKSPGATAVPPGVIAVGCVVLPAAIGFVIFSLMTLLLLDKLRRALKVQAQLARETWAQVLGSQMAE